MIQRQSEESGDEEKEEEEEPVQAKLIQRQNEEEEEEPVQAKLVQRQPVEEEEESVQTKLVQRQPEEEEEPVQAKLIQRQPADEEEEPVQAKLIQRQPADEEEEPVQTKLIQRQPADEEEEPVQTKPISNTLAPSLQRQSEEEEEEAQLQTKLIQRECKNCRESEEQPVQAKAQSSHSTDGVELQGHTSGSPKTTSAGALSGALARSRTGESLNSSVKNAMESSTGLDFSAVRIHSDSAAHSANRAIRARAFTHGLDIWLGRGESQYDRRLMAHELTHVVQQNSTNGGIQKLQRKPSGQQPVEDAGNVPDDMQEAAGETVDTSNILQTSPDISRQAVEGDRGESRNDNVTDVDQPAEKPVGAQGRGDSAGEDDPTDIRLPVDKDTNAEEVAEESPVDELQVQRKVESAPNVAPRPAALSTRIAAVTRSGGSAKSSPKGLIQRQQEDCPPADPIPEAEVVLSPASPRKDPAFNKTKQRVKNRAKNQAQHGTGDEKSSSANAAAEVKAGEKKSHGQKTQVGEMDAQAKKPPIFDKKAFITQVLKQVRKIAPKTVDDFIRFASRGKANEVKNAVTGQVKQSQKKSQGPLDQAARKDPGAGQSPRTATTLKVELPGKQPGSVRADRSMPPPRTESEVDFQTDTTRTENILKEACITREYMDKHNDPELKAGAEAQDQLKQVTSESPQKYRDEEAATLAGARAMASSQGKEGNAQMFGERSDKFDEVGSNQQYTKTGNEGKRDAAASEIDGIFKLTQTNVQERLKKLDIDVETTFDVEAGKASQKFQSFVDQKAKSLKKSSFESLVEIVGDFLFGPPPRDAVLAYESGRRTFVQELTAVIKKIAGLVEIGLKDARKIVAKGKLDVKTKLDSLDGSLDTFKQQKSDEMNDRFRSLEGEITNKQADIIQGLANRYVYTLKEAKKAEKSIRDKYKNIVDRAKDVYNKIKDAVLGWIEKLKAVVGGAAKRIIRQPGKFLRNLGAGIVQGFTMFMNNIGKNIQGAVVEWLTGNMGGTVSLPKTFDTRGIIGFLMELVGLGIANIKNIARKVFGAAAVSLIEKGVAGAEKIKQIFDILAAEGPAGLFKFLASEFEKMKGKVMAEAGKAIAEGLVVAGIKKALGLISGLVSGGVGSVITIVVTIIDVVMWIRDNAARIAELVSTIAGMAMAILNGQVAAIAGAINNVLKRLLPMVLGFVGALVGIGGVVRKIQKIFKAIKKPATRAITKLFKSFKKLIKKLIAKVKKKFGKGKRKKKLSSKQVVSLVMRAMKRKTRSKVPGEALAEKQSQAKSLLSKYQPRLKRGQLKISILDRSATDVKEDAAVDFEVSASPGKKGEAKLPTPELKFKQGENIKVKYTKGMWVAKISRISADKVYYRYNDERKPKRSRTKVDFQEMINAGDVQKYTSSGVSKRLLYMGANPSKWGSFGQQVLDRYTLNVTFRYVPATKRTLENAMIRYPKRASGTEYTLNECDLSHHPTDAVTFWNKLKGEDKKPRSPKVLEFMKNPQNYIYEELSSNRRRGSKDNERYSDPNVV